MTHPIRALEDQDEPALLRDQFRQLLRYRALLVSGVVVGLLGGGWLALSGEASYTATGEVFVRSATSDPFATGASADKGINIGSERQTAVSDAVGTIAARSLAERNDQVEVGKLLSGLQVTNPPNTLVLRFSYTGRTPALAKRRAEALADAYLQIRRERTENSIDNMVAGYRAQLKPLTEQRDKLAESAGASGDDVTSARANLVVAISELSRKISELRALDTTPGYLNKKPVAPEKPTGAGLPLLLGLGGVVGLALGLLLSWVRLVFDPAVRSTRELVRSLGAPLLGTLPRERGSAGTLLAIGRSGSRLAEEYRAVAFRLAYDPSFEQRRRSWSPPRAATTPRLPPRRSTWQPPSPRWAATCSSSRPICAPRHWPATSARPYRAGPGGPPRATTAPGRRTAAPMWMCPAPAPSP